MADEINVASDISRRKGRGLFPIRGAISAALLLAAVGCIGYLSVGYLKHHAELLVNDTLGGLADSSVASANLVESFNCMTMLVMTGKPEDRFRLRSECERHHIIVNSSIAAYSRSIYAEQDRANYQMLLQRRQRYAAQEKQTLALLDQGKSTEARQYFKSGLVPAYRDYRDAADIVMKFNADEGRERGGTILSICTYTQITIAGAAIMLFITGFLIGVFK